MKSFFLPALEVLEVLLIAFVSVAIIKTYLAQPFLVSGDSMEPNLSDGNYLLVDEISYRFREPERGEVVVFRYPQNESVFYVKRVIGLPGETVKIDDNKVTIINDTYPEGLILEEDYLPPSARTAGQEEVKLEEGQYFVMGDNRLYSFDSRSWGILPQKDMLGVVRYNLWPINKARAVAAPTY